jgi:hypothetical protein
MGEVQDACALVRAKRVEMYASTLLLCRTSGRPPKVEGAWPPLFSIHWAKLATANFREFHFHVLG